MKVSDEAIFDSVRKAIAQALEVEEEKVTMDASLEDLGAESLDFMDIAFKLEKAFNVQLLKVGILEKMSEVVGEGVLEDKGALTEAGADLLRKRMPEVDPSRIKQGLAIDRVNSLFKVRTVVRGLREVLESQPTVCGACGADRLVTQGRKKLRCEACEWEVAPPSGDDVVEEWVRNEFQPRTAGS